jgi:Rhodopirellula transposase DDE domain
VVELIGATTTKTGLKVESALDTRTYQKGIKVSRTAMKCLEITGDPFHPGRVSRRDCTSGFSQNSA